jgi:hypothetical protein
MSDAIVRVSGHNVIHQSWRERVGDTHDLAIHVAGRQVIGIVKLGTFAARMRAHDYQVRAVFSQRCRFACDGFDQWFDFQADNVRWDRRNECARSDDADDADFDSLYVDQNRRRDIVPVDELSR